MIGRCWRGWLALLDRKETGEAQAIFRIVVGLVTAWALLSTWWPGHAALLWVDAAHGGYRKRGGGTPLGKLRGGPTPAVGGGLCWAGAGMALMVAAGIWHRVAAFATLQCWIGLTWLNGHGGGSYDELITNALWLLVLANASGTLSLSARLRSGSWTSGRLISAWPRYLAIGQLVVVYGTTGLQKLSAHWLPGGELSALYYILQQPSWQRIDMSWLAPLYPLTQLATFTTWCWEMSAPLLIFAFWCRHTRERPGRLRGWMNAHDFRTLYAGFGIAMHLGIWAAMDVGPFTWISLAYCACLWHPDEWTHGWRRLQRRGKTTVSDST